MIIEKRDLSKVREQAESLVFTCGCFNLLHPGHVYFLKRCKSFGDILVVAVAHDEITKYKRRPVINQEQRMYMVDNLKCVNYVILENNKMPPKNIEEIVKQLRPNYFITNRDNPNLELYNQLFNHRGIYMRIFDRNIDGIFNISTTDIIRGIEQTYLIRQNDKR